MTDEQSQQSGTSPVNPTVGSESPAVAGESTSQDVPQSKSGIEDEPRIPLRRFQGEQQAHARTRQRLEKLQTEMQEREAVTKQRLRELETRDMTDADRKAYEAEEKLKELQRYEQALYERDRQVQSERAIWEWRDYFREEYQVPADVLMRGNTFYELQDAVIRHFAKQEKEAQQSPQQPQRQPLGQEYQVQSRDSGTPPSREFDGFLSGQKNLKDFRTYRKDRKRKGLNKPY